MARTLQRAEEFLKKMTREVVRDYSQDDTPETLLIDVQAVMKEALERAHYVASSKSEYFSLKLYAGKDAKLVLNFLEELSSLEGLPATEIEQGLTNLREEYLKKANRITPEGKTNTDSYISPVLRRVIGGPTLVLRTKKTDSAIYRYFWFELNFRLERMGSERRKRKKGWQ